MADLRRLLDEARTAARLRRVAGALVFSSPAPLGVEAIRRCLREIPGDGGGPPPFGDVRPRDVRMALEDIRGELGRLDVGVELVEVAGGYRFQTRAEAAPWVRAMLGKEKPALLSPPALETLAIIAYRQPVAKSEIEGIRGVAVDHVVRALVEMRLVRVVGRSDLPGRPFLYGTTQFFLEHFGLKDLGDLDDADPTLKKTARRDGGNAAAPATTPAAEAATTTTPAAEAATTTTPAAEADEKDAAGPSAAPPGGLST